MFIIDYIHNTLFLSQLLISLATLFLLWTVLYLRARHRRHQLFRYYGIPGPKPSILEGNYDFFRQRPFKFELYRKLRDQYGKIFGLFFGDVPRLVVTDMRILKKVFVEDTHIFKDRAEPYYSNSFTQDSILFVRHHRWKGLRKLMSPAFSSYAIKGDKSVAFIEDTIDSLQNYIHGRLDRDESGKSIAEIDVLNLMKSATLYMISIIATKLPGVQISEHDEYVKSLNQFVDRSAGKLIDWAMTIPFVKLIINFLAKIYQDTILSLIITRLDSAMNEYANQDKKSKKSDQVIDALIKLHHQGMISRNTVIGNALALLLAGYDTTSVALTYILWALAKHNDVQDKLRTELIAHGTDSQYLEQVINETLRLYPPVIIFTSRKASETVQYGNVVIPKGTTVIYNSYLVNRDPEIWPDPMKFDPERFGPGKTYHPCAFAPFGFGERRCLGFQLAMLEMRMLLCAIIVRYKVLLISPDEIDLVRHAEFLSHPMEKVNIGFEPVTC